MRVVHSRFWIKIDHSVFVGAVWFAPMVACIPLSAEAQGRLRMKDRLATTATPKRAARPNRLTGHGRSPTAATKRMPRSGKKCANSKS